MVINGIAKIVFDFDQVLVEGSDEVKQATWPLVFKKYGGRYVEPLAIAQKRDGHGAGGDRYTMMESVFKALGEPEDVIARLVAEGAQVFDEHVQIGIGKIGVQADTRAMLERLSRRYRLYVNTATPREPFLKTIDLLGIGHWLSGVYGRPFTKVQNLEAIAADGVCSPNRAILFVGDSPNDYLAAKEFDCWFIGLIEPRNDWASKKQDFPVVTRTPEIESFLPR